MGRFLRERRGRRELDEIGAIGHRRRRGTLTQEDLARLTGYSVRTISALEQGAEHRPTPELLEAIAAALRLSTDERSILWYLATGSLPPAVDDVIETDPALRRTVLALDPHPAYLTDAFWQVEVQNSAFATWICDFTQRPAGEQTILHWFFLDPHSRHVLVDWHAEAAMIMARLRARMLRSSRSADYAAMVEKICARSADARQMWERQTDVLLDGPLRDGVFRRPGHTDPLQPNDSAYHVRLSLTTLAPVRTGDERRLVAFLLPDGFPLVSRDGVCGACLREAGVEPERLHQLDRR